LPPPLPVAFKIATIGHFSLSEAIERAIWRENPVVYTCKMVPEAGHQRFRLKAQMMAVSDKHTIIDIPAGAEVVLLDSIEVSTPTPELNRQVNIQWRGQTVKLFAVDLFERAERL
jgi:hypothetical protein